MSPVRRANLLRAWLADQLGRGPAEALVQRLLDELPKHPRGVARWPVDAQRECRAYRGRLTCGPVPVPPGRAAAGQLLDLSRPGLHEVPGWAGVFEVRRVRERGVAAEALRGVTLTARQGGERFQLAPQSLPRSLKKQFQAAGVPEWDRQGPLAFAQGRLLFAPGLGIDARWWGQGSGPRRELRWLPAPG